MVPTVIEVGLDVRVASCNYVPLKPPYTAFDSECYSLKLLPTIYSLVVGIEDTMHPHRSLYTTSSGYQQENYNGDANKMVKRQPNS